MIDNTRNDKIFIELLKYGAEKGLKGTDQLEVEQWAAERYLPDRKSNEAEWNDLQVTLRYLFEECFHETNRTTKGGHIRIRVLKNEYYFRLIEYQELQESRRAAREASRNAWWAIRIAVAAIIVSAVLTYTQLNTPTTINKSDLNALIESNRNTNIQSEVKLDSLQMAQILSAIGYSQPKPNTKKQPATDQGKEVSHHELINKYFEDQ